MKRGNLLVVAQSALAVTRADLDTLAHWYGAGAQAWRSQPLGLRELASKPGMPVGSLPTSWVWRRSSWAWEWRHSP